MQTEGRCIHMQFEYIARQRSIEQYLRYFDGHRKARPARCDMFWRRRDEEEL